MFRLLIFISLIFVSTGFSKVTFAVIEFTTSETVFTQQNPNLRVQTFESGNVEAGNLQLCNTPVDSDSDDDCFEPGDILQGLAFTQDPDFGGINLAGPFSLGNNNPVKALVPDGASDNTVILFPDNNVNAVGINIGCLFDDNDESCNNEVYFVNVFGANNELLGSTTVPVSSLFDTFVGITSDQPIERIQFGDDDQNVLSFNGVSRVLLPVPDGVVVVPTLSTWGAIAAVLGFGLGGILALRSRVRVKKS